ncbi:MAG: tRNA uridine-5-carboxymethylaminomethyl(34) synthesis GTPase MnmE [Alphaproteobacteria bacterium]|nr:tRNA uridine-5-carboxymethylaminomethyl(34) synthesis GTPase MnmE [Alphaproteobacteria bacterium]MBQ8677873.1 tRNA uridine-5-carboxymethylaminomethyl(34) synthesis GTPase MnmE [Alphaproteobacteria bacterium]
MDNKTIYALSTVYGKSGVAVIRISGQEVLQVVKKMTTLDYNKIKPRYAYFVDLKSIETKETLDKCLLLYFKSPHSFTGEDIVELQIHGSKAVISLVMKNLSLIKEFRLAEPGEYSKRAFYNGKMDLTQAEGLADLIESETAEQQKYAMRQMEGSLKNLYSGWREELLTVLSYLEAYIDFPDEDIPENTVFKLENTVFKLSKEIKKHLSNDNIGERLREGFRVVIVGSPNAGKSSLLNAIVNREAVIVSDIAGTTRDAVDIYLDLKGYPVMFTDTAGLREVEDVIEKKGIEIAYNKIEESDLIICLFDSLTDTIQSFDNISKNFSDKMIFVANKCDKISEKQKEKFEKQGCVCISAKYKQGIDNLLDKITTLISSKFTANSNLLITRSRYSEALKETLENLDNFNLQKEIELSAEDIRLAARGLGKITGQIEVDEILDKIFGSFCIGK